MPAHRHILCLGGGGGAGEASPAVVNLVFGAGGKYFVLNSPGLPYWMNKRLVWVDKGHVTMQWQNQVLIWPLSFLVGAPSVGAPMGRTCHPPTAVPPPIFFLVARLEVDPTWQVH